MSPSPVLLRTERLALRRFTADDAELAVALHGDPDVMRFIDTGRPVDRETVLERTLPEFLSWSGRPGEPAAALGVRAAEVAATGEFLGWFELRPTGPGQADEAELGYRLCRAAWGRGCATEGARAVVARAVVARAVVARAVVARAFGGPGGPVVRRIRATAMTVNHRSRRVLEKAGLRYVRTFFEEWPDHIEGAEHGDVEYAVSCDEWAAGVASR